MGCGSSKAQPIILDQSPSPLKPIKCKSRVHIDPDIVEKKEIQVDEVEKKRVEVERVEVVKEANGGAHPIRAYNGVEDKLKKSRMTKLSPPRKSSGDLSFIMFGDHYLLSHWISIIMITQSNSSQYIIVTHRMSP